MAAGNDVIDADPRARGAARARPGALPRQRQLRAACPQALRGRWHGECYLHPKGEALARQRNARAATAVGVRAVVDASRWAQ